MDKSTPIPPTLPSPTSQQQHSTRGRSLFRSTSRSQSPLECSNNVGPQRARIRFHSRRSASSDLTTTTATKRRTSTSSIKGKVTAKPVKEKAIKIRRSSVSSFFGRLSVGKSQSSATTVYLDGREMGLMAIRDRESAERIRERFLTEMKGFVGQEDFHFWYAGKESHIVDRELEATTKIKDCMDEHHILHCRTCQFMSSDQTMAGFNISEERLRDLAPEAESVVRCCFRLLEDTMTLKAINKNADANLPNQALNCVKFIKDVARAAVDSRRTKEHPSLPNVHWEKVQKCLHELEDLFRDSVKHEGIAVWWFYKTHQKNAKQLISEIQREFRQSPNLQDDHPVFFVHLKQASPQAEALATTLDKIAIDDFISKKHEKTRIKLAAFLSITEEELRFEILNKKSNILFSHHSEDRAHFREQNEGPHRNSLMKSLIEKGGLKGILDPLHDFQDEFVDRLAADFQNGTRDWALEAFDAFLAAKNSPHRAFIVTGQASSGKSCLAAKLIQTRREIVLGYQFCRHDDYRYREAKSMLLSLSYQLTLQSPHYERRIRSILTDYGMTRTQLLNSERCSIGMIFTELLDLPLSEISVPPSERYVILIDGLDEAKRGETGKNEILDAIRELFLRLPNWILFVFTTKPRLNVLKKLRLFNAVMVEPNSKQDAADLATYFTTSLELDNYGSKGDRDLFSRSLIDQAKGSFLYAKIISLKFSEHGAQSDYLSNCMMRDLNGVLNLEFDTLTGPEEKNDTILFWRIVKLAMVAIKPLHKDVIKALTGCDDDELDQVLRGGTTFFALHDSRVRFLHKTVKDWLLQKLEAIRCNDSDSSQFRPTRRLSFAGASHKDLLGVGNLVSNEIANCHNFFAERILTVTTRNRSGLDRFNLGSPMTRNYVLQHGVHHLALAHRVEEARDIILDPAWLIARAVEPEGIVECCELIGEADQILHLVGRAVTLAIDSIRSDPRQLIGQLVGRLMAATIEGHGDSDVRESIIEVVHNLKRFDYGFQWWCPVAQTWHQAEQVFLRKLIGHTAPVQCVAWHSDSRRCASSSWDATIRVWDSQTGTGEQIYTGHTDTVFSIHWETKGNRIVSGSLDRSIKIWNTESEECEATLFGHTDSVWCVQWSTDNARIASSSKDKTVRIWCSSTGKELKCLTGHEGSVYSVAWEGGTESRLCTGATDNSIRIWDTTTGNCLQTLDGHKDWIRDVHWGLCGTILSASADHTIRVWTSVDGRIKCQQVLMGHADCCWSVSMSRDSRYAVSGSTDSTVKVWNLGRYVSSVLSCPRRTLVICLTLHVKFQRCVRTYVKRSHWTSLVGQLGV
jgi:WD domain, G-beta repeat